MKMSREWIIVMEGLVPLVLGAAVLITVFTRRPLAKMIMRNESVADLPKIEAALDERGSGEANRVLPGVGVGADPDAVTGDGVAQLLSFPLGDVMA